MGSGVERLDITRRRVFDHDKKNNDPSYPMIVIGSEICQNTVPTITPMIKS